VEIKFDMYSATLHKVEVLKLEKRLDSQLYYLRDAPQEYSTVPFDFDAVPLPKGATVPVNAIKVSAANNTQFAVGEF
jgi:large subunit ribosomal protein L19